MYVFSTYFVNKTESQSILYKPALFILLAYFSLVSDCFHTSHSIIHFNFISVTFKKSNYYCYRKYLIYHTVSYSIGTRGFFLRIRVIGT